MKRIHLGRVVEEAGKIDTGWGEKLAFFHPKQYSYMAYHPFYVVKSYSEAEKLEDNDNE